MVCGWAVVLSDDDDAAAAERAMAEDARFEVGERTGRWLPVAVVARDMRAAHDWVEALPGVDRCEVVFVGGDDVLPSVPRRKRHVATPAREANQTNP